MKKILLLTIIAILLSGITLAWTPTSNINLRGYYNITNLSFIEAFNLSGNINAYGHNITNLSYIEATTFNGTVLTSNSSNYWDSLDTPSDISISDLNSSGQENLDVNSSDYWDSLNSPADITISDLNNSGQENLNVNSSDYWDSIDTPLDITALGTITSGVWHGSAIEDTYLDSLSASKLTGLSDIYYKILVDWANITNKFITAVDNEYIYMNSTTATLNETKLISTINANDDDTTYSASGTLLDLTGTTFSIREGTLTDGKGCEYSSASGLVCDNDFIEYSGLTQNWNQGAYNFTNPDSWFLGKVNWSSIQTTPTTIDGYGITDALRINQSTPQIIVGGFLEYEDNHSEITDRNQLVDKAYVDDSAVGIGINFYFDDETDGNGYRYTNLSLPEESGTYLEATITSDDQYVGGWRNPANFSLSKLFLGIYDMYISTQKVSGNKDVYLYWTLVLRYDNGTEIDIANSSISDIIPETETYLNIPLNLNEDLDTENTTIIGKIYASLIGTGTNPTIRIYYLDGYTSRWVIPSNREYFDNLYIKITQESDLNVNSSDYWDDLDSESDLTPSNFLNAGDHLSYSGNTLNVGDDWWDSNADISADEISEDKISFSTSCGADSKLYISGNDLACNSDQNTNCSTAGSCSDIAYLNYQNTGDINVSGDVCITGGKCLSETSISGGDISSVQGDNVYIYNGSDVGDVVLAFNVSAINAGDITDDGTYIKTADENNLNVNSSDYWDDLNSESDLTPSNFLTAGDYLSYSGNTLNVDNSGILGSANDLDSSGNIIDNAVKDAEIDYSVVTLNDFTNDVGYITEVDSSELDNVCSVDNKILKRSSGTWACADDIDTQLTEEQVEDYIFDENGNLNMTNHSVIEVKNVTFADGGYIWSNSTTLVLGHS